MRDFPKVIEAIKKQIPTDFDKRESLIKALDDRVDSYYYTAPELISDRWGEVMHILFSNLGDPDTAWKETIAGIYTAQLNYEEYL